MKKGTPVKAQHNNKINFSLFSKAKILIIGDIMLDCYLWGTVDRISPEAPVPIVHSQDKTYMLGGAGNVALNVASLGCHAEIIAFCGQDRSGKRIKEMLKKNTISHKLFNSSTRLTTTKTRIMALKQQLLRIDEEEPHIVSESEREALLTHLEKNISQYDTIILSDYGKGVLQTDGLTESIIDLCNVSGVSVLIDPKGNDWKRYRNATCITPNSAELMHAAEHLKTMIPKSLGDQELIEISNRIRDQYGIEWLLVTRGAQGMCLTGKDQSPLMVSTEARQVYDVSGAGDTVISVLATGVSMGLSFKQAAKLANTAAGIVVGKVGTQPVTLEELKTKLMNPGQ